MSICLFRFVPYSPPAASAHAEPGRNPESPVAPVLRSPAFTFQVEQSISISRESLLNLEFAVSVSEEANGDARARGEE